MEQAERGTAARSQNVVHFLPRTTDALTRALLPALERIDAGQSSVQLVVVTPDAESAIAVGEIVHGFSGAQGIEIVPVTAANRAARILADRPVHAVAGPAVELRTLVERSALKLENTRTIVLAWPDDQATALASTGPAIEAIFAEVPKDASRILLARRPSPEVDQLIEQHMRSARRLTPAESAAPDIAPAATLHYVSVSAASRPAALRRLLDELDPPSAAIVVRDPASETDAVQTVRSLGYRRADDPVRVARYDAIPASHTVVLYDAPVMPSELAAATAGGPVQVIALATPRDLVPLHEIAERLSPLTLEGPAAAARSREAELRAELTTVLAQGTATRELLALEPLLDRYDGLEIAAAALRLLEAERTARREAGTLRFAPSSQESAPRERPARERPPRERSDRDRPMRDRPPRDRGDRPFRDRPPRERSGERSGEREFRPRPPRPEYGDRGSRGERSDRGDRGDRGERRERNLGRGPRSGGPGRDERDRRPGGPRRPRPFER
jgi:hypothetical protein